MSQKPAFKSSADAVTLLTRGASLSYLGVVLLLPLAALGFEALRPGPRVFFEALSDPLARYALGLSFTLALAMAVVNAVIGTATAWVLVHRDFPGKALMNSLIDLPFAVPTVVAGLMLVALYGPSSTMGLLLERNGVPLIYHRPGVAVALLFVTYPFVIRSVQPVWLELDPAEEEAAATLGANHWTTFFAVTLPALRPAVLSGAALAFSRALGEFGGISLVAGNRPLDTQTASLYVYGAIEGDRTQVAAAVSIVLLAASFAVLLILNSLQNNAVKLDSP